MHDTPEIGSSEQHRQTVEAADSIQADGRKGVDVLATPAMILLVELNRQGIADSLLAGSGGRFRWRHGRYRLATAKFLLRMMSIFSATASH